jgi:glycosyltransferase involved in cell wall biosynthesis
VSDFSRRQLCQTYSVAGEKVHTIPNGVDRARFFPGDVGNDALNALGLRRGEYFLTVGRLEPRKNHANLLRAWAALQAPRPLLVMIGQRHFGYTEVFSLINDLGLKQDVTILETVSDELLPSLYRAAMGFVYCSWAEGFGMPVLEAMASGVPVISSSNTALSEVCANAAFLVDPGKPDEIANAVTTLVGQPSTRNEMVQRGLIRAKEFSWESAAQTVRRVYLGLLGLPDGKLETQSSFAAPSE